MTDNLKRITEPPKAWHEGYDAGRRWLPTPIRPKAMTRLLGSVGT